MKDHLTARVEQARMGVASTAGVGPTTPTQPCKECGGLGHFPFGNGNSAGKCADCKGTGRVPDGVGACGGEAPGTNPSAYAGSSQAGEFERRATLIESALAALSELEAGAGEAALAQHPNTDHSGPSSCLGAETPPPNSYLKPCPFCGAQPEVEKGLGRETHITCKTPLCAGEDLYVAESRAWNRRAASPPAPQVRQEFQVTAEERTEIKEIIAGLAFICEITDTGKLVDHAFDQLDRMRNAPLNSGSASDGVKEVDDEGIVSAAYSAMADYARGQM